jgi:anti-sigma regulatory factor (Ser/Thr protein kinase)
LNQPSDLGEAAAPRERVLILFRNQANRALLLAMLGDRYRVIENVDDLDRHDPRGPYDLCIIDSISLQRMWLQLHALREQFRPLLLPILVLADRRDTGLFSRRVWDVVDDLVLRPVDRLELALRVQSLMRLRAMSVQLSELSDRFEHERRIAHRLQDAALPHLTALPGLTFHAVYRAGSSDATIGGDWYDVLRLPDGRVVMIIGDVAGSGIEASITMMSVRQALRGIAFLHSDPAMMLDAADRALKASEPDRIVTAFVGVYDAVTSVFRFSSAGHPWPFVRRSSGAVEQLQLTGTPLGLPWRVRHTTSECLLCEGDLVVLYTDGLTEAERDPLEAERRLFALLASPATATVADAARAIYDHMIDGDAVDDVAIAAIAIRRDDGLSRWSAHSDAPASVRAARDAVLKTIATSGFREGGALEIVLAELIGNVARHAPGPFEIALDCSGDSPVLHVLDEGRGFRKAARLPSDMLSEGGRGLYIVAALTPDFTIERRFGGGSHARVVLPASGDVTIRESANHVANLEAS